VCALFPANRCIFISLNIKIKCTDATHTRDFIVSLLTMSGLQHEESFSTRALSVLFTLSLKIIALSVQGKSILLASAEGFLHSAGGNAVAMHKFLIRIAGCADHKFPYTPNWQLSPPIDHAQLMLK